ncbi:exported hypothetical protein [Mesorhizobium plurifarium]|uniref:Uncharacterized protein n=1 Tax=Mesorhizobium plurifarium TaxID=69974 RepID=A0A0K2VUU6_MESPL|nr:exported hypothetical protein [Mesorhizobium plurifarium]
MSDYWLMVFLGALVALALSASCLLVGWLQARPRRSGFEVRYEHLPVRRHDR